MSEDDPLRAMIRKKVRAILAEEIETATQQVLAEELQLALRPSGKPAKLDEHPATPTVMVGGGQDGRRIHRPKQFPQNCTLKTNPNFIGNAGAPHSQVLAAHKIIVQLYPHHVAVTRKKMTAELMELMGMKHVEVSRVISYLCERKVLVLVEPAPGEAIRA